MRAAILFVVIAVVVITGAWWLSSLPGDLSITIGATTLQASTPVALTLLALLFLALYAVIRLLAGVVGLPGRHRLWRRGVRRRQGDAAVNRALVALAASDAGAARREAERSRRLLGDTPLTLLLAAQAGRQAGREAEAESAFRLLADRSDGRLLGLRGLMRQAMAREDWTTATAIAKQAEAAHPGAAWLRDEQRAMAVRTGNWTEALRLATPAQRATLAIAASRHDDDPTGALRLAQQAHKADPALTAAAVDYARRLRESGRERVAEEVLRRSWSLNPQPDIAEEYARFATDKLGRARELAELARSNPDSIESTIAAGRAALEAGLTADARRQVEAARARGANERRLWVLSADIASMDGDEAAAQDALRHLAEADPDPVWRCGNCGTEHGAWHPVCDACEATGTIAWTRPGDVKTMPGRGATRLPVEGLTS